MIPSFTCTFTSAPAEIREMSWASQGILTKEAPPGTMNPSVAVGVVCPSSVYLTVMELGSVSDCRSTNLKAYTVPAGPETFGTGMVGRTPLGRSDGRVAATPVTVMR